MPLETGSRFGRYSIEALLGEGGMGAVYRAFDTVLHRRVALKVLHPAARTGTKGETGTARILREARAAAALHHPNAVALFDVGEQDGEAFIAMELCAGRSLREVVRAGDATLEQRLRWLLEMARALAAAHRVGVVHLDIKPENVMVGPEGSIKVLDFGIARQVELEADPTAPTATMTARGTLTGTPAYMAPEQVRKLGVDGRCDQFSWGVVAYELLGGRIPWSEARSLFDLLSAIVHEAPPDLRTVNAEVPEEIEAAVMRALAKRPDARFPDMGSLVEVLDPSPAPSSVDRGASSVTPSRTSRASLPSAPSSVPSWRLSSPPRSETGSVPDPPSSSPPAPAPEPARRATRGWRVLPLAIGAVLAVAVGARVLLGGRAAAPATEPARAGLLDLAPPADCNAAALAHYRAGIVAEHDGDWDEALQRFEEATRADPGCAGAHLRLVLTGTNALPAGRLREIFQQAVKLRGSLSERNRRFLDALDPLVRRDPTDEKEFAARMAVLADERPGDAELVYYAGVYDREPATQIARARAALAIDPHYSDAYQLLAHVHKRAGQTDEALSVLDECVRAAPGSIDCVKERADLHRLRGQCGEVVGDARLWIARAPQSANGYFSLALGLAGQGAPFGAVEEALRQRWARLTDAGRAERQALEEAQLAALAGRFERTAELAGEVERRVEADPSYDRHAPPALLLVNVDRELGRLDRAAARAADFLGRIPVWSVNLGGGSDSVRIMHVEPLFLDVALQGRRLQEPEWRAARAAWLDSARRGGFLNDASLWALGTAMAARTPAEAAYAVRSIPPSLRGSGDAPYPQVLPMRSYVGRALLLAGEVDAAVASLRRAAGHCDALMVPFEDTQAHRWLGEALEKKGDAPAACAAYRVVLKRWGQASPLPESAAAARARVTALACPP